MPTIEPQLIHSELFRSLGITAFFSERQGGVSQPPFDSLNFGYHLANDEHSDEYSISVNMKRLMAHTGLTSPPHQTTQEHGIGHIICSGNGHIHKTSADILISSEGGCPVAVRTADCLPILLADPVNRIIAAVHAGWRGTAKQVVANAIKVMEKQGANVQNIHASLGPCIGSCCFEIDEACATQLISGSPNASDAIIRKEKPYADLTAINIMQLQKIGVSHQHIESNDACTCCNPDRFYSYRRDHGNTGRHLGVVVLPDDI
ncbi:MAG: peptidoglycan editing factor PgeF [Mariprofundaceae bacterium]